MTEDDIAFGQIALKLGFMDQAQVAECLQRQEVEGQRPLSELCLEHGYIDDEQLGVILMHHAEHVRSVVAPPPSSAPHATRVPKLAVPPQAAATTSQVPNPARSAAPPPAAGGSWDSLPEVGPDDDAPQADTPQINAPQINAPQINAPQINAPQINAPQIDAPQINTAAPSPAVPRPAAPPPESPQPNAEPRLQEVQAEQPRMEQPNAAAAVPNDATSEDATEVASTVHARSVAPSTGQVASYAAPKVSLSDLPPALLEQIISQVAQQMGNAAPTAEPAPAAAPAQPAAHGHGEVTEMQPTADVPPTADPDLVNLLMNGRKRRASDVHLASNRPFAFRIQGHLRKAKDPVPAAKVETMLFSVMTQHRRKQLERLGYSDFAVQLPDAGRYRVNVSKQSSGLKGCFRIIAPRIPTLQELGLPAALENVANFHQGLAVVAGPTGMGKTTTLAALVGMLNRKRAFHIITAEDPIELVHPRGVAVISQREIGVTTASFARALKAALREDPDVIVIGELRDEETVEIALEAAETGHLVVATMNTRSGAKTIDRLIDMFPPDKQAPVRATLAGTLKIIVSQRLIPAASGDRVVPAVEIITGNTQLWNLIRDNKLLQLPSLMQRGRNLGMLRFDESLLNLAVAGTITDEIALANADAPGHLKSALEAARSPQEAADASAAAPQADASKRVPTNKVFRRT